MRSLRSACRGVVATRIAILTTRVTLLGLTITGVYALTNAMR